MFLCMFCQLLLKFEQFTEADYETVQPFYFALDWEAISKRRKAADELEGFPFLKEKSVIYSRIFIQFPI